MDNSRPAKGTNNSSAEYVSMSPMKGMMDENGYGSSRVRRFCAMAIVIRSIESRSDPRRVQIKQMQRCKKECVMSMIEQVNCLSVCLSV